MTATLRETPLHNWHASHGARMVDFGGWSMPVQYTGIVDEHQSCRTRASLFDVSHMGRLRFDGEGAAGFLDRICTRRIAHTPIGKIRYSLVCNEAGGILDDVLVYHLCEDGNSYYWMVVNASNREKIVEWINQHLPHSVEFSDHTCQTAMIAVQGPQAIAVAQALTDCPLRETGYYTGIHGTFAGCAAMISRTGYTGEDGVELTVAADAVLDIWERLMQAGADSDIGIAPAGLGARDTLRLEAAMPLYGHELSERISPLQAGLGFAVNFKDRDFIGRDALLKQKHDSVLPVRIGLELVGRRVPREHCEVFHGEDSVGEVTSGTFSPTLQKPIAMAYVRPQVASTGTSLSIDIRGRHELATIVDLPFYQRT